MLILKRCQKLKGKGNGVRYWRVTASGKLRICSLDYVREHAKRGHKVTIEEIKEEDVKARIAKHVKSFKKWPFKE